MHEIAVVKLNKAEKALFDSICWDPVEFARKDDPIDDLEKMAQLAESLLGRKAIPEIRLAFFTDPGMNVAGCGKSRQEVFKRNGTSGRDILRHPHFMAYLWYFMNGPDLPKESIRGFCRIVEEDRGTSGMVLDQLKKFVRKEVRDKSLEPIHAADEFFKLAHEIKMPSVADSVRSAAKSGKR